MKYYKQHKRDCRKSTDAYTKAKEVPSTLTLRVPAGDGPPHGEPANLLSISDPTILAEFDKCDMLHNQASEDQVLYLLVNIWRMRLEDKFIFHYDAHKNSAYGDEYPMLGFGAFLSRIEMNAPGVLPSWWVDEKRVACLDYANHENDWSNVHKIIEKRTSRSALELPF